MCVEVNKLDIPNIQDMSNLSEEERQYAIRILKELSDKNVPLSKRKESLDIYQQMCSSAQIIVNVCKLELEIDKTSKDGKKR